jgi:hypothetical protein
MLLYGECCEKGLHLKAYKLSIVRHTVTFGIVKLFLKHFALPVEVTLNSNYPTQN